MTPSLPIRLRPELSLADSGGLTWLVDLRTERRKQLPELEAAILRLADGSRNAQQIIAEVIGPRPQLQASHVEAVLTSLASKGAFVFAAHARGGDERAAAAAPSKPAPTAGPAAQTPPPPRPLPAAASSSSPSRATGRTPTMRPAAPDAAPAAATPAAPPRPGAAPAAAADSSRKGTPEAVARRAPPPAPASQAEAQPAATPRPAPEPAPSGAASFRKDLRLRKKNAEIFEVCDPIHNKKFDLYAFEVSIARMLDGTRAVAHVVEAAQRLGIPATQESIQKFIRQLNAYGFLETSQAEAATAADDGARTFAPRERWSEDGRKLFQSALRMMNMNKPRQARDYLQALLEVQPDTPEALEMLALVEKRLTAHDELADGLDADLSLATLTPEESPLAPSEAAPQPAAHGPAPAAAGAEAGSPEELSGAVADPAAELRRDRARVWGRRAMRAALGLGLLAAAFTVPLPLNVTAECRLEPLERATVRSKLGAFVQQVLVREGERVEKGQPLALLGGDEAQKRLERREAEVAQAESELELAREGTRPEEIARLETMLSGRRRALAIATKELERLRQLQSRKLASAEEIAQAEQAESGRRAAVSEAQAELNLARAGARAEELSKREAELRARKIDLDVARRELESATLVAPIAGVITTPRLKDRENSRLAEGEAFCEVEDTAVMQVIGKVPEREMDVVRVGQRVSLKVINLPNQLFTGTLKSISPIVEEDSATGARFVRVELVLENPKNLLKPNVSGYMKIHAGKASPAELSTRRIMRWLRLRFLL